MLNHSYIWGCFRKDNFGFLNLNTDVFINVLFVREMEVINTTFICTLARPLSVSHCIKSRTLVEH